MQLAVIFDERHGDSRVVIKQEGEDDFTIQVLRRGNHHIDEKCFEIEFDDHNQSMVGNYIEFQLLRKCLTLLNANLQVGEIDQTLSVKPAQDLVDEVFDKLPSTQENERDRQIFKGLYDDPLDSERAYYAHKGLKYSTYEYKRKRLGLPAKEMPVKLINKIKRSVASHKVQLCHHADCQICLRLKIWHRNN